MHLPYTTNWTDYERVDGEMEFDGIFYNYVKRKVSNDTLYLMCLPNTNKTRFYTARNEYAKQVNGAPSSENNGRSLVKKINIANEYNQPVILYSFTFSAEPVKPLTCYSTSRLVNSFIADQYRPPKANRESSYSL